MKETDRTEDQENRDNALLNLAGRVNDPETRRHCLLYYALYETFRTGVPVRMSDLESSVALSRGSSRRRTERGRDFFTSLEETELHLASGETAAFVKDMEKLETVAETTLFMVGDDPLFLYNRVSVLKAMSGKFPESLRKSMNLIEMFPSRSNEKSDALRNLACTAVDCMQILGANMRLMDIIREAVAGISKKALREETAGLVSRKLCMRSEALPAEDPDLIGFAKEFLSWIVADRIERNFTEIQIAVAESMTARALDTAEGDSFRRESTETFRSLENRLVSRVSDTEKTLLRFNLVRGLAQAGFPDRSREVRNYIVSHFEENARRTVETMDMIEKGRSLAGRSLPHDLRVMGEEIMEMSRSIMKADCLGLCLAARYSADDATASRYLEDVRRLSRMIPFPPTRVNVLLHLASSFSYRNRVSEAIEVFDEAYAVLREIPGRAAVRIFSGDVTSSCAEAYFNSPHESLINQYLGLAGDLGAGPAILERAVQDFLRKVYFCARDRRWRATLN